MAVTTGDLSGFIGSVLPGENQTQGSEIRQYSIVDLGKEIAAIGWRALFNQVDQSNQNQIKPAQGGIGIGTVLLILGGVAAAALFFRGRR